VVQHRKFMDLALDDEGLHTPDGVLDLTGITKAEVVRHWNRDASRGETYRSHSGGVGGALLGGAVAGPVGFIGGALLGSAIDRDGSSEPHIPRMVSATVTFESADLAYTTTVGRDRVEEAEAFVAAVKAGAGHMLHVQDQRDGPDGGRSVRTPAHQGRRPVHDDHG